MTAAWHISAKNNSAPQNCEALLLKDAKGLIGGSHEADGKAA